MPDLTTINFDELEVTTETAGYLIIKKEGIEEKAKRILFPTGAGGNSSSKSIKKAPGWSGEVSLWTVGSSKFLYYNLTYTGSTPLGWAYPIGYNVSISSEKVYRTFGSQFQAGVDTANSWSSFAYEVHVNDSLSFQRPGSSINKITSGMQFRGFVPVF